MAVLLENEELEKALKIFEEEKELNLFLLNNIERNDKRIKTYKVDDNLYIQNYHDQSLCIYSTGTYNLDKAISFIESQKYSAVLGPAKSLKPLEDYYSDWKKNYRYLLRVNKDTFKKHYTRDENLKVMRTKEDFSQLYDYYFDSPFKPEDDKTTWVDEKLSESFPFEAVSYIKDGQIVCSAYLSAATKRSAMVVGVLTKPGFENQKLAQKTVTELTDIALNENNIPYLCLWYSTPVAYHIYEKLGYQIVGEFANFKK